MADIIEMIQLSPTMDVGVLVEWLKKEGDDIKTGDLIAEVETDKTSMEMESFFDGVILKILAQEGSSVKVGHPLAIIGERGEDISALLDELTRRADPPAQDNAASQPDKLAAAPETPPEDRPPKSEPTPREPTQSTAPAGAPPEHDPPTRDEGDEPARVLASPVARRIAQENDLPLRSLHGSGPAGRIIKRDVEEALAAKPAADTTPPPATTPVPPQQTRALSPMRRAIAKNTTEAWKIPAFMLTRTVRMDAALAARKQLNAAIEKIGGATAISVNDLIIKASAIALQRVPAVNVAFRGDELIQYGASRIGVAVAIPDGLLTPVIENAEGRSLRDIAATVQGLAVRAREKKLRAEEFSGASFSISNLGMFGVDHFTAVLNPPGAAILAVGGIKAVLVPDDSERGFHNEQQMSVTLTCDHRALDGAIGAQWLQVFADLLENPMTLVV